MPLSYVHSGTFSGSAVSLESALRRRVAVRSFDVMGLARDPRLWGRRVAAVAEAAIAGIAVPWTKTAVWSRTVQRTLGQVGFLNSEEPLLLVQTLTALNPEGHTGYAVYTDRVGLEGAAVGNRWASRFSPGWLERETELLRSAQRIFVMGPSTAEVLADEYEVDPGHIRVVGAGPNARLGPARYRVSAQRILFVGTQWELKGGPELLRAFEIVRRRYGRLQLTVVGSQPSGRLPEGVTVAGRVVHDRMDALYDESDILVIPTHQEAFGISLLEGLMKGLPCICSTVGNQQWLVGDAGVAVNPGNVLDLAAAISSVIDSYPEFHARALARGEALKTEMSWDRVAEVIISEIRAS